MCDSMLTEELLFLYKKDLNLEKDLFSNFYRPNYIPFNVEMSSTRLWLQYMVANYSSESYKSIDLVCELFILMGLLIYLCQQLSQTIFTKI